MWSLVENSPQISSFSLDWLKSIVSEIIFIIILLTDFWYLIENCLGEHFKLEHYLDTRNRNMACREQILPTLSPIRRFARSVEHSSKGRKASTYTWQTTTRPPSFIVTFAQQASSVVSNMMTT